MEPGLYIVGTPIGNLDDFSPRAIETLKQVDVILAEDTRHTRKLAERFSISTQLVSCHKFNEASRVDRVIADLSAGKTAALVSDSGMPGVSDPGGRLVKACRDQGVAVWVIPGPSAVTSAIALCGWGDQGFIFDGFLSNKSAARRNQLTRYAEEKRAVVLFESPHRILKFLLDVETTLGSRPVFVGRELTKKFEQSLSGTAKEVHAALEAGVSKGEFVIVIAPYDRRAARAEVGEGDA
jgi:16S rRNA (cytidine1402-2'-O)-methyltransferase